MNDIALLVVSCDAYCDLWDPAIDLIEKEWEDIPFDIYWGSNLKLLNRRNIKNISVGEDKGWCSNLDKMLNEIPTEYVIFMLEDFFLTDKPESKKIVEVFNSVKENHIDCCRLIPNIENQGRKLAQISDISLIEIPTNTSYRISTQIAIWRKDFLRILLNPKFSAWDFEGINSKIVDEFSFRICCVNKPVIYYKHGVERGKWLRQGIDNLHKHNLKFDFEKRGYYEAGKERVNSNQSFMRKFLPEFFFRQAGRVKRYSEYRWMKDRAKKLNLIK